MRLFIALADRLAQVLYALMKGVLPSRRKVVLLSRQSDAPSRDFCMLADELRSRDVSLEVVTRCRMIGGSVWTRAAALPEMIAQMYHLAGARACVVDGYVIPVSLLAHRRGTFVVQMWHALGAFKKFGYQTLDRPGGHSSGLAHAMRMHHNYDVVVCSGPDTVPAYAQAFGTDADVVRPLGLPRLDHLLTHASDRLAGRVSPTTAELRRRFPVLADPARTTVLYAPTFRHAGNPGYQAVTDRFAGDRYAVIVKPHPLETASAGGTNVVIPEGHDVLDLLPVCDVVITDYSAVAFEAVAFGVPVYFFVHDIDSYREEYGLNIDPLIDMPDVASRDIDRIGAWIESGHDPIETMRRLQTRYLSALDGHCTERVADLIMAHVEPVAG